MSTSRKPDARLIAALRFRAIELDRMRQPTRAEYVRDMAEQIENDWSAGWARRRHDVPEQWGKWQTPRGRILRAYRGTYNRVRFYDAKRRQVGPEQSNVAPAIAYAMAKGWRSLDT